MLICYECGKKRGKLKYSTVPLRDGKCHVCRDYKPVTLLINFEMKK